MKDTTYFYRNDLNCLIAKDERSDEWMCFIGFNKTHPLFNVRFHRYKSISLYKYCNINTITSNKIWKDLNWLGCSEHPYSEKKTLQLLKDMADALGPKPDKDSDDDLDGMINHILDMIRI